MTITPAQSRSARALTNWTQPDLAHASGTSLSTIRDFETGKRTPIANNLAAIRSALEQAGVTFLEAGDSATGPGVALKDRLST
jgi:transcriptional regulator with XRE-family HTH domain